MAFELESFNLICGGLLCTNFRNLKSINVLMPPGWQAQNL